MNDRYLFRGKLKCADVWATGFLAGPDLIKSAVTDDVASVDPLTVGQCTGLRDKCETLIFEGDVCRSSAGSIVEVIWCKRHRWAVAGVPSRKTSPLWQYDRRTRRGYDELEVIGNIYDDPELLEVQEC